MASADKTAAEERQRARLPEIDPLFAIEGDGQRSNQVTEALKRYILMNRLPPGARLPPERQLASTLLAGRNAVREALHSLVVLGIVEKRHGSGIYVRDFDADRLGEQLSYGLREDAEYWAHLLEARAAIEVALIPLVAQRITDDQLAELHRLYEAMGRQFETEGLCSDTDYDFHLALIGMAANPVLERMARTITQEYFRYLAQRNPADPLMFDPNTLRNHRPLLAALAARDPEASIEGMRYHYGDTNRYVEGLLRETEPSGEQNGDADA
jgi:GntR family transcriptional repressor for pyruvate dehydrogenase complex